MPTANVNDPASLASVYEPNIWEHEAGLNSRGGQSTFKGLLIESAPNTDGDFQLRRATRGVSYGTLSSGEFFVCPFMGDAYDALMPTAGIHGAVVEKHDILRSHAQEYPAFLADVLTAVRSFKFGHSLPGTDPRTPRG